MAIERAPLEINLRAMLSHRRNFHALLWLCGWGGAAAIALIILVVTSQTKSAGERLRGIFAASEPAAVAQIPPRVTQLETETESLIAQVRILTADRDRLAGRIALLESSIDDMTGAIRRQADTTAAALAARAAPAQPVPVATVRILPPTNAASTSAAAAPSTSVASVIPAGKQDRLARETATASVVETQSEAISNEFGLDLGGAPTLEGVRQRWIAIKASFGPLLSGMRPLAARDRRQGITGYRLIAGPLPNSPAAAGLCAHFNAARTPCHATKFDGEQLTIAQH